jgi:NitT/TauT family transport system substrate-binding protein
MKRKQINLFLIFLLAVAMLSGMRIYLPPSNISLPFCRIADQDSLFQAELYREVNTEVLPEILKQKEGYYLIPTNVAAKLFNSGLKLQFIASFATEMLYLLTDDVTIKSISDFEGKEFIVGGQGSSPDIIIRYLFAENKVTSDINYRTSPEIARFFIAGKYHNCILPQPLAEMVLESTKRKVSVFDVTGLWKKHFPESIGIPQLSLIYVGPVVHTGTSLKLIEDFNEYAVEMNTQKSESALQIKEKLGYKFSAEIVEQSIKPIHTLYGADAKQELLRYFQAIMDVSPDAIGGKIPDETFFTD